jgi:guanylate kinase
MSTAPLIIVSGVSGTGKTTVIHRVLTETPEVRLRLSISATTRAPRRGEVDGRDYHFWTAERFRAALEAGDFFEHALVHGSYYGTLRSEVEPYRLQGVGVLLDVDVQGAQQIRQKIPDAVTVFLRARSMEVYEQRLRGRGTESEEAIVRRLAAAQRELAHAEEYQYQVVNDHLDQAVAELRAIVLRHFEGGNHAG